MITDEQAKKYLAANLKSLMEERKNRGATVSQSALAESVGVSVMTINYYIHAKRMATAGAIANLAEFFGVSTDYLLAKPAKNNSQKSA